MFDFPTSPATGTASNGYVFDGEKWLGNPGTAAPVTEQFFDVTGLSTKDITVPAWAKSCEIEGLHWAQGVYGLLMRYSVDGTTFLFGASDYGYGGPYHNTGTSLYQTQAPANYSAIYLTYQSDNAAVPHHYVSNLTLVRGDTAKVLGWAQTNAHTMDTAGTTGTRTFWLTGYMSNIAAGSALAIKAIRIMSGGPTWTTGSFIRVKWFGDSAQVPTGNAIADCPSDGGEYVRVNGVWRLKSQTLKPAGVNNIDVTIPTDAIAVKINAQVYNTTTGIFGMRISDDGTTFKAGAAHYSYNGVYNYNGTGTITKGTGTSSYILFGDTVDANSWPIEVSGMFSVVRPSTGTGVFEGLFQTASFQAAAAVLHEFAQTRVGVAAAGTSALSLKALRFLMLTTGNMANGSAIDLEWVY